MVTPSRPSRSSRARAASTIASRVSGVLAGGSVAAADRARAADHGGTGRRSRLDTNADPTLEQRSNSRTAFEPSITVFDPRPAAPDPDPPGAPHVRSHRSHRSR